MRVPGEERRRTGAVSGMALEAGAARRDEAPADALKVLVLNSGSGIFGGVSAYLYQVFRHLDREKISFDFLSPEKTTYGLVREEIRKMGGNIIELNIRGGALMKKLKLYAKLKKYLTEHPYRIVHINSGNFFFNLTCVFASKAAGVPVRIVHSHNAGNAGLPPARKFLFAALKGAAESAATDLAACSRKAAEYMFRENTVKSGRVHIFRNGIETERFRFDPEIRSQMRRELHLEKNFVVGHVGRFMEQKNHAFLLDIFAELLKIRPDSILLLLGEGELKSGMEEKARALGVSDRVVFAGQRPDMERIYQAMDVFVLPSLHEGLPVSGIEAQAAGLPAVFADTITPEVRILDSVRFLPLTEPPGRWAEEILAAGGPSGEAGIASGASGYAGFAAGGSVPSAADNAGECTCRRAAAPDQVKAAGYDVSATVKELEKFYDACCRREDRKGK